VTPGEYILVVFYKLLQVQTCEEIVHQGVLAIEKLKSEGHLRDTEVRNELIRFSILIVASALQKLRIAFKS